MQIPDSWQPMLDALVARPGVVAIIGRSHVGKSTLVRWLASGAAQKGIKTAVLDADVGQSHVGPPGTLGLASVRRPFEAYGELQASALFFVGALSPAGCTEHVIKGISKLVGVARRQGHGLVLVNTSGDINLDFKRAKLEALKPDHVVAIQDEDELEPLLEPLPEGVHRLRPAQAATAKSDAQREAVREEAFGRFFEGAQVWDVMPIQVRIQALHGGPAPWVPGTLLGLVDGAGVCLGVGIALPQSRNGALRIFTKLPVIHQVRRVLMGAYVVPQERLKAWVQPAA